MGKYIKLSPEQKDEVRRLTQLANRRIRNAEKAYRKQGLDVLPRDVVGKHQIKEQWATKNTPISRSVRFESHADYRRQLNYLRSFERNKPGIKEYSQIQQDKTIQAMEKSLGTTPPQSLIDKVSKMDAAELSQFWKRYSDKASKLGMKYASKDNMESTVSEFFDEDLEGFEELSRRGA